MADVTKQYLNGLLDLDRSFVVSLEVGRVVVSMGEAFEELLEVTRGIVEATGSQ